MGCDIHMHIEYKKTIDGKTKWVCGDYFKANPYYGVWEEEKPYALVGFCDERNYALFSTLANVRNYGNTNYICEPKGLPSDVCEEIKKDADDWGIDGHSHSWFTLKELLDYQKLGHKVKYRGMISKEAQIALDEDGIIPNEWCQMTNQKDWGFREWLQEDYSLNELIEKLKERAKELYYIYDFWWDGDYQKAYELADGIRIVFWFDN